MANFFRVLVFVFVGILVSRCATQWPLSANAEQAPKASAPEECLLIEASEARPLDYEAQDRLRADGILSVSFSPDGAWIASAGYLTGKGVGLRLWEVKSGKSRLLVPDSVTAASFSPDGKSIAYANGGSLYLLKVASGESRLLGTRSGQGILTVSYSPDGAWIATGFRDGTVYAWRATTGEYKYLGRTKQGDTDTVVFSPKGRFVASGGDDQAVRLWDVEGGAPRVIGTHKGNEIFGIAFSPDGKWVASAASNDTASPCLWEVKTAKGRCFTSAAGRSPYSASFAPSGELFALGWSDGSVSLHKVKDGSAQEFFKSQRPVYSVAFSPNGKLLATGESTGVVSVWEVKSKKKLFSASVFSDSALAESSGSEAW